MPAKREDERREQGTATFESLAHDIRGSLHAMRMGRELLKQMYPDEKLREVCEVIEREERRASELLDKLLAAARGRE